MAESQTWRTLKKAIKELDPYRVENLLDRGCPDVNFVDGWIELKHVPKWPVRGGVVRIEHYTNEQRIWLMRRWRAGGKAFLLIQAEREWLLYTAPQAQKVGELTVQEMRDWASVHWPRGLCSSDLVEILMLKREYLDDMGFCK